MYNYCIAFMYTKPVQNLMTYDQLPLSPQLRRELRSNHAGEIGAVEIYRGILKVSRDPAVRVFAREHMKTEHQHLAFFEDWLPPHGRSRARPVWRLAGFCLGAFSALFGASGVYQTIEAVETFVDRHYADQIESMQGNEALLELSVILEGFRQDEISHRDQASEHCTAVPGWLGRSWCWLVGTGSQMGVILARRW